MKELIFYLDRLGIPYDGDTLDKFETYYGLLTEWNAKFNLTALTERADVVVKHFADSLYGAKYIGKGERICDVGSGAGFPAIPLAIARPDIEVDMYDSLNKRVTFLNAVIENLGLKNARAEHTRIEDVKKREYYDAAVARAVAPLPTLIEYCVPYVKTGGALVAYKGGRAAEEISSASNALDKLRSHIERADSFVIDGTDFGRTIVVVRKDAPTPPQYPRGKNKPRDNPL